MKPEQSKEKLIQLIKDKGFEIGKVNMEEGFSLMSKFYKDIRFEDCKIDQDGDMLLFQWRSLSAESMYEVDIVRQFTLSDLDADNRMSQLHLTFSFPLSDNVSSIQNGNVWCHSLKDMADFNKNINDKEVYSSLKSASPISVKINYELI